MSVSMIHFTQTSIRLIETHWQSYATIKKKPVSVIGTKKNKPKIGRYWFLVVISMIGLACRHLGKKFGASAILCVFRIIHLSLGQVKLIWRICPLLPNWLLQTMMLATSCLSLFLWCPRNACSYVEQSHASLLLSGVNNIWCE